jgi:magnesium transporter
MSDSLSNTSEKTGMPPGTLVHVGDILEDEARISVFDYSKDALEELEIDSIDALLPYRDKDTVTWVNIEGLRDIDIVESVGRMFNIHPLVLEDILNTHQRPKFEEYDNCLYIVLKALSLEADPLSVSREQISILVLKNFVFTFKEKKDDIFAPLGQRLRNSKGRIRSHGSDYLAYAILDTVVDENFSLLDTLDEVYDSIEERLLTNPSSDTLMTIQRLKRELILMRKSISPLRELLAELLRSETELIAEKTQVYFRDVYDHAIRITETLESYRDMLGGLLDIYLSSVSYKMNEVMKVLTIFASIFIPLTFIAGIYGMNFENMPELKWTWAYPALWVVFVAIAIVLLVYFRKKKWL